MNRKVPGRPVSTICIYFSIFFCETLTSLTETLTRLTETLTRLTETVKIITNATKEAACSQQAILKSLVLLRDNCFTLVANVEHNRCKSGSSGSAVLAERLVMFSGITSLVSAACQQNDKTKWATDKIYQKVCVDMNDMSLQHVV